MIFAVIWLSRLGAFDMTDLDQIVIFVTGLVLRLTGIVRVGTLLLGLGAYVAVFLIVHLFALLLLSCRSAFYVIDVHSVTKIPIRKVCRLGAIDIS